ncbi:hypothetical protein KSS93_16730 [Pseudomonas xanthosomatis]|uniref:hypothetical protein n=1 Tax=Pseudomonas xanthosomatis TaxID=2842356 RepID=UPI001C3DD296|nr:hypothetical protein [Pseudomonas xanthosomatis]QXH44530.1 hypothetical protein KSS93_16730 [Pseudomonas xanthosomatis]
MTRVLPLFNLTPMHDPVEAQPLPGESYIGLSNRFRIKQPIRKAFTSHELVVDSIYEKDFEWNIRKKAKAFRKAAIKSGLAPTYTEIPHHYTYQRKSKIHIGMKAELDKYGIGLTAGQILFHGGDTNTPLETIITNRPMSLTLIPQIAVWHANYDAIGKWNYKTSSAPAEAENPTVWIIRVSSRFKGKVILYRKGGANMEDEMECVLGEGNMIQPWHATVIKNITVVHAYLH